MLKTITFLIAGFLVLFAVVFSARTQETPTITAEDIYDSFIYEDYVVEGTIKSIELKWVLHEEYNPYISNPALIGKKTQVVEIGFSISRVLIGDIKVKDVILIGKNRHAGRKNSYLLDLKKNDRMIIPIRYVDKGAYKTGEKFQMVGWDSSRFIITDDSFLRGLKDDPIQNGNVSDLYNSLEEIKNMRSTSSITKKAELIVQGFVIDKWVTDDTLSTGRLKYIERIRLSVNSFLKGESDRKTIEFSILTMAGYNPFWRRRFTEINEGEEWIVFLKWAEEPGYYPFAGINGMFKVEGDKLVRDNRIIMEKSLNEMKAVIRNEVPEGGKQ